MFFTALIILIILILVGNYVYHYYNTPTEVKVDFPPANYMAQIGAQCPNMWDITAINQKTVTCKNNANLPLSTDPRCGTQGTIMFPTITEWPVSKKNTKAQLNTPSGNTYSRCQFAQNCGRTGTNCCQAVNPENQNFCMGFNDTQAGCKATDGMCKWNCSAPVAWDGMNLACV